MIRCAPSVTPLWCTWIARRSTTTRWANTTIREFDQDRLIAWTILGKIRPQIGHIYGYRLEPADGGTLITSFYDWSGIDPQWRDANIFPVVPESALRATLGILDR